MENSYTANVLTRCHYCDCWMHVPVVFPEKGPFVTTNYRCTACHSVNIVYDGHKFDENNEIVL